MSRQQELNAEVDTDPHSWTSFSVFPHNSMLSSTTSLHLDLVSLGCFDHGRGGGEGACVTEVKA